MFMEKKKNTHVVAATVVLRDISVLFSLLTLSIWNVNLVLLVHVCIEESIQKLVMAEIFMIVHKTHLSQPKSHYCYEYDLPDY